MGKVKNKGNTNINIINIGNGNTLNGAQGLNGGRGGRGCCKGNVATRLKAALSKALGAGGGCGANRGCGQGGGCCGLNNPGFGGGGGCCGGGGGAGLQFGMNVRGFLGGF